MDDMTKIEQLLSELAAGTLTGEQAASVQSAVAQSPQLARTFAQYQTLHRLLKAWRTLPASMAWDGYAARVRAELQKQVRAESSVLEPIARSGEAGLDDFLAHAVGPVPAVDWNKLHGRISASVRSQATQGRRNIISWRRKLAWFSSVCAPLAAAAVVAFMVWGPRAPHSTHSIAISKPLKSHIVVALDAPDYEGKVTIQLDEGTRKAPIPVARSRHGGYGMADGPSAHEFPEQTANDAVALLY